MWVSLGLLAANVGVGSLQNLARPHWRPKTGNCMLQWENYAPSLDQAAAAAANRHSTRARSALGFMACVGRLMLLWGNLVAADDRRPRKCALGAGAMRCGCSAPLETPNVVLSALFECCRCRALQLKASVVPQVTRRSQAQVAILAPSPNLFCLAVAASVASSESQPGMPQARM